MAISYAQVANEYRSLGWAPIPAKGKKPVPAGATGRSGTVTDEKVAAWSVDPEWMGQNTALRADGWIGIDVDAYDDKHGDQTILDLEKRLGDLPVTITSTSRGIDSPSRQHFYKVPDGMEFDSNLPDVEIIQHGHRYSLVAPSIHPITGSRYEWYGYEGELLDDLPAIDDLEMLPPAWLAYLAKTGPEHVSHEALYGGTVDEWLARCEPGEPDAYLREWVANIPAADFGHDVMIQLQSALVALGADGKRGVPWALDQLRSAWLREPYDTAVYRADWGAAMSGAVAKFGAFTADILGDLIVPRPESIDYVSAAMKVQDERFFDLWIGLPEISTPEVLEAQVQEVLKVALADGSLTRHEAIEVAWQCAARKAEGCPIITREGVEALAVNTFLVEEQPEEVENEVTPEARLLTEAERVQLKEITWWGDDKREEHFMARMQEINPVMSPEYYRLNRWILLSLVFAPHAVIPTENGTMLPLNIYGITLGPSGSGKSESLNVIKGFNKHYFVLDDDPDIGGDSTAAAITKVLTRRDGLSSFFHADEADKVLRDWSDSKGPFSGMKNRIMDIFGGDVPTMNRSTDDSLNGRRAKAYLCVHLTGVDERIRDAIEPHDWESGFINRFIWAKGERKTRTREQKKFRIRRDKSASLDGGIGSWFQQWGATFGGIISSRLVHEPGDPKWIDMKDDVIDRHVDTTEKFERMAAASPYPERLRPTFTRMEATILKCAALVAITDRRTVIEMDDYLIALEQAEEWTETLIEMVGATDETPTARRANRLAQLIRAKGGQMRRSDIHATKGYAGDYRGTLELIRELEHQGRVEAAPIGKVDALIRLTEGSVT